MKRAISVALLFALPACRDQPVKADLPSQADRWVNSITLQKDSVATHVGKTSAIVGATKIKPIRVETVAIGENVDGVQVRAIKCTFFMKDASYSGEKFMWRGRWGCHAGGSREEVDNAVGADGEKLYDYVYVSPVTLG